MTWLIMLLLAATPVVSYGLACTGDGAGMMMSEPQDHHEMPCHGRMPCPDLDGAELTSRLADLPGGNPEKRQAGSATCCIATASAAAPFAASSPKGVDPADPESDLPPLPVLPSQSTTRHPRLTAGPPLASGAHAGARTYLTTARLRL